MRGLAVAAVTLLFSAGGSTASGTSKLTLRPTSSIPLSGYSKVIADGRRAAAVAPCGIMLWTAGKRTGSFTDPCRPLSGLDDSDAYAFALAGNRLAWLREEWVSHGMVVQTELVVKTGAGKPREIASAYEEYQEGSWLLSLAGAGDTLAAGWTYESFADETPVLDERVYRIGGGSSGQCPSASGLLPNPPAAHICRDTGVFGSSVRSVSQGRILVTFGAGSVGIIDRNNQEHDLSIPRYGESDAIVLAGSKVVLLNPKSLEIYDADTGEMIDHWGTGTSVHRNLSVAGDLAVFGSHLMHLRSGAHSTLVAPGGKPPIATRLSSAGLFFLYKVGRTERLGFVRASRL
ncbi:MAG: hypothetical protein H0W87_05785 [Actinobacteria bacterium]|nr:hypothetical protein [Actinomycetota bacterium]